MRFNLRHLGEHAHPLPQPWGSWWRYWRAAVKQHIGQYQHRLLWTYIHFSKTSRKIKLINLLSVGYFYICITPEIISKKMPLARTWFQGACGRRGGAGEGARRSPPAAPYLRHPAAQCRLPHYLHPEVFEKQAAQHHTDICTCSRPNRGWRLLRRHKKRGKTARFVNNWGKYVS